MREDVKDVKDTKSTKGAKGVKKIAPSRVRIVSLKNRRYKTEKYNFA